MLEAKGEKNPAMEAEKTIHRFCVFVKIEKASSSWRAWISEVAVSSFAAEVSVSALFSSAVLSGRSTLSAMLRKQSDHFTPIKQHCRALKEHLN